MLESLSQKIIQKSGKLLDDRARLTDKQLKDMETVHRCALEFLRNYHSLYKLSPDALAHYLKWEAINQVTMMVGYSELLMMGFCGRLEEDQQRLVEDLTRHCYLLQDTLRGHKSGVDAAQA